MTQRGQVLTVVHVISGLDTGGAEMMLLKLVSASTGLRHTIVSLRDDGELADALRAAGATVHALNVHRPASFASAPMQLARLIWAARPCIVQGWMNHGNVASALLTPPRIPVLWNVRQSLIDFDQEKRSTAALIRASPFVARRPRTILYNSRAGAEQHEAIGYPRGKRLVIPNGFDTARFSASAAVRQKVRARLGVAEHEILIGLVARFHPMKNQLGAIAALRIAIEQDPRLRLLLVGTGTEASGPNMAPLLADPVIARHCLALGLRHDVAELTGALDIALSASLGEGFSNTIGEAMACAVPCIVTDVGDSGAIVGDTGEVVPRGRPDLLAGSMLRWASAGRTYREAMGSRARQRVVANFSIDAVARMYEQVYLRTASSSG